MTNYRVCRVSQTGYAPAFEQLYARDEGLRHQPSEVQARRYFDEFLVYGDSFSRAMRSLGNESHEILCNAEHIQKKWAEEHAVAYDERWVQQIVRAQITHLKPDVVYVQGITSDPSGFLPEGDFRARFPFVKLVVAYSGYPHQVDRFGGVDVVLSCVPQLSALYAESGIRSPVVYHAFDEGVIDALGRRRITVGERDHGFTFCGLSGVGYGGGHRNRYWDLVRLILDSPLEAWVYDRLERTPIWDGITPETTRSLAETLRTVANSVSPARVVEAVKGIHSNHFGDDSPLIPLSLLFPDRCRPPVFGLEMFATLSRSKLTFNRHTDALEAQVFGNIRVFEATGMGSVLVSDFADDGRALFEPGREIVTYASAGECVEKVNYLLDHDGERAAIAEAGRKRTLSSHTVLHRCEQIHDIIGSALKGETMRRSAATRSFA